MSGRRTLPVLWVLSAGAAFLMAYYGGLVGAVLSGGIAAILLEAITPHSSSAPESPKSHDKDRQNSEKPIWIGALRFIDQVQNLERNDGVDFEAELGQVYLMAVARLYKEKTITPEEAIRASKIPFDLDHRKDVELLYSLHSLFILELYDRENLSIA